MDDHWGAEPPLVAAKVRLRDVLKLGNFSINPVLGFKGGIIAAYRM
jgi:hypothetical protein